MGSTEGERWAAGALADLRAGRFTPAAWIRFLAASVRRSGEDARRRPDLARQALAWGALGLAPWVALAPVDPRALWGAAWWLAVVAMLLWHLGMVEGPAGERRSALGAPDALTLGRAALVPALPLAAAEPVAFLAVVVAGGLSDALDGPLARRGGRVTRLGASTDGAVDVAFALAAAWTATAAGWLPGWAGPAVSARYLAPPLLIAVFYFARAGAPPREAFLAGRLPGVAVASGLALAAVAPARPAAAVLVAAGLAGGVLTAAVSVARVARAGAGADAAPAEKIDLARNPGQEVDP